MKNEITIWKISNTEYGILSEEARISNKINKILKNYYDTNISNMEEVVFIVNENELDLLLRIIKRYKGDIIYDQN